MNHPGRRHLLGAVFPGSLESPRAGANFLVASGPQIFGRP